MGLALLLFVCWFELFAYTGLLVCLALLLLVGLLALTVVFEWWFFLLV